LAARPERATVAADKVSGVGGDSDHQRNDAVANFGTLSIPSMTEVVYKEMRDRICRGIYPPGQIRLKTLADSFGVSAVPVREALRRLQAEGLVAFGPNRRITINSLSERESEEIFLIRSNLETMALRHTALRLKNSPERIALLEELIGRMDAEESSPDKWRQTNQEWHRQMYLAADMPRLESMISSLWAAHEFYLRLYVLKVESFRQSQEEHRQILREIVAGNVEAAVATLEVHLANTAKVVTDSIHGGAAQTGSEPSEGGNGSKG
jgi:DNA-binding GntR family transcriptional regulator